MKRLKILSMAALLAITMAASACTPATTSSTSGDDTKIKTVSEGKLKVGLEAAYPPFNWTQLDDSNGAVKISNSNEYAGGYDVEIAKRIAAELNLELEIVKTDWKGLPVAVQTGVLDAIIAGMSPTEERKQQIDFSDNYYKSDLVVVVKKDSKYASATSIADFKDAKITAQLGTFHASVISQIEGVKEESPMTDFGAMRTALSTGVIDGYVSEKPEGISASAALKDFTYVEFAEGKGFTFKSDDAAIAVGLRKGSDVLRNAINTALSKISEEERSTLMENAIKNQPANAE